MVICIKEKLFDFTAIVISIVALCHSCYQTNVINEQNWKRETYFSFLDAFSENVSAIEKMPSLEQCSQNQNSKDSKEGKVDGVLHLSSVNDITEKLKPTPLHIRFEQSLENLLPKSRIEPASMQINPNIPQGSSPYVSKQYYSSLWKASLLGEEIYNYVKRIDQLTTKAKEEINDYKLSKDCSNEGFRQMSQELSCQIQKEISCLEQVATKVLNIGAFNHDTCPPDYSQCSIQPKKKK